MDGIPAILKEKHFSCHVKNSLAWRFLQSSSV